MDITTTLTVLPEVSSNVSAQVLLTPFNATTTALLHEATATITNIDTGFWHTIINFIYSLI